MRLFRKWDRLCFSNLQIITPAGGLPCVRAGSPRSQYSLQVPTTIVIWKGRRERRLPACTHSLTAPFSKKSVS